MIDHSVISLVLTVAIALSIIAIVVYPAMSNPKEVELYYAESQEWCEDRDGDLYNANVIGSHGGLHCELPNGTSVHMSDVEGVAG